MCLSECRLLPAAQVGAGEHLRGSLRGSQLQPLNLRPGFWGCSGHSSVPITCNPEGAFTRNRPQTRREKAPYAFASGAGTSSGTFLSVKLRSGRALSNHSRCAMTGDVSMLPASAFVWGFSGGHRVHFIESPLRGGVRHGSLSDAACVIYCHPAVFAFCRRSSLLRCVLDVLVRFVVGVLGFPYPGCIWYIHCSFDSLWIEPSRLCFFIYLLSSETREEGDLFLR